jgi:hypothetical protein
MMPNPLESSFPSVPHDSALPSSSSFTLCSPHIHPEFIDVLVPDDSSEPHRHDNRYYAIYGMDDDDNSTAATAASPTSGH